MNILILMGRGVEGTGQTRTAIELHEFLSKDHSVVTLANNEKKWNRAKSQDNEIMEHNFKKEYPSFIGDKFDRVIVASVPALNYSVESKENFTKLIESFVGKAHISYVQVDHKIHSINRNYYNDPDYSSRFFNSLDLIVTHDLENDFCKKFLPKQGLEKTPIIKEQMFIACDFESLPKYTEKRDKTCYFIGRAAFWKGWVELKDLHHNYLKDVGYMTYIDGVELSIGMLKAVFKQLKPERIVRDDIKLLPKANPDDYMEVDQDGTQEAHIFGPYVRKEALKRVGESKFGMFFTYIGEAYGGPVENTLMEIIGVGTVPVVRKELWDTAKFSGDRLTNYKPEDIGFVVYDSNNAKECVDLMNLLDSDKVLYGEYVKKSYAFAKKNFDREFVLNRFWEMIK